jgi:hypothetical protein
MQALIERNERYQPMLKLLKRLGLILGYADVDGRPSEIVFSGKVADSGNNDCIIEKLPQSVRWFKKPFFQFRRIMAGGHFNRCLFHGGELKANSVIGNDKAEGRTRRHYQIDALSGQTVKGRRGSPCLVVNSPILVDTWLKENKENQ